MSGTKRKRKSSNKTVCSRVPIKKGSRKKKTMCRRNGKIVANPKKRKRSKR